MIMNKTIIDKISCELEIAVFEAVLDKNYQTGNYSILVELKWRHIHYGYNPTNGPDRSSSGTEYFFMGAKENGEHFGNYKL